MTIVLDTCALIWWSLDPDQLSVSASELCDEMEVQKNGLVASISLWEIALKVQRGKLDLGIDLDLYVETVLQSNVVKVVPIDVGLWVESVRLDWGHRDPADRLVVALATQHQAQLITKDNVINNFYEATVW